MAQTLIRTCLLHGVHPRKYLIDVLQRVVIGRKQGVAILNFRVPFNKDNLSISKDIFISNLRDKLEHQQFRLDIQPLIEPSLNYSIEEATSYLEEAFLKHL